MIKTRTERFLLILAGPDYFINITTSSNKQLTFKIVNIQSNNNLLSRPCPSIFT